MQPSPPNPTSRAKVLRAALPIAFVLFFVGIAIFFSGAVLPFVLAIFVAYIFAPLVARLTRPWPKGLGTPRWVSVLLVYFAFFSVVGVFSAVALPKLAAEVAALPSAAGGAARELQQTAEDEWLPAIKAQIRKYLPSPAAAPASAPTSAPSTPAPQVFLPERPILRLTPGPEGTAELDLSALTFELEPLDGGKMRLHAASPRAPEAPPKDPADAVIEGLQEGLSNAPSHLGDLVSQTLTLVQRVLAGIVSAVAILVLMFMVAAFLLIDSDKIFAFLRSLVPSTYRGEFDELLEQLDQGLAGVIRGQVLICVVNGVLTAVGFLIFGVKFALILAVLAGVMSLIPIFGSILSSIPAVAVALAQAPDGPDDYSGIVRAALVLGWILLIHFIEANFLNPKIIGTSAKINPALVVLVLVAGEHTFGLVGALLAVPTFSILQTIFLFFRRRAQREEEASA